MRDSRNRSDGLSHRLWWLAAALSFVVGFGIVLDTPQVPGDAPDSVAHRTATTTARGG